MVGRQDGGATDGETTGVVEIPAGGPAGRLTVTGQLDPPARDRLLEEVARLTAAGTAVELDLRQLVWIDSSGLGTMIRANRLVTDAGAPRMRVLVAETGMVRRLLQLTMLHLALDVVTV